MTIRLKLWTGLGLGVALASGGLVACSQDGPSGSSPSRSQPAAETDSSSGLVDPAEDVMREGEGGEGEGGVNFAAAASDPVVFVSALAIAGAHALAARDAFLAGENDAAAEMFAHPVSEVLADMAPAFEARGVADFNNLFIEASVAVLDGAGNEAVIARTDDIFDALNRASQKAPDSELPHSAISVGVIADQIARATDMYRAAAASERYEPYLDGYGFYQSARLAFEASQPRIERDLPETAAAISIALAQLERAYPGALRPAVLDADTAALTVAASQVELSAGR